MVYRGLPSCLESQFAEQRTLRLRLSSPKPHFSQSLELTLKPGGVLDSSDTKESNDKCHHEETTQKAKVFAEKIASSTNPHSGDWSFFQTLSNTSQSSKETPMEKENTYVHPLVKRSSSRLSEKSLELCTESLGSETGTTDVIETSNLMMSSYSSSSSTSEEAAGNPPTREQHKTRQLFGAKKASVPRSFPPPLTTMSGSESLQVRPHREDGRLIIKAVKTPSSRTYFQAERSNGRLRLCLIKDSSLPNTIIDHAGLAASAEENTHESNNREEIENDANINDDGVVVEEEEQEEEEKLAEEDGLFDEEQEQEQEQEQEMDGEECYEKEEEMDGNELDVGNGMGMEMEMEELQRSVWCKGELENKGLLDWKLCCVATS
ncbi:hypothetical protein Tsubulata_012654 [Turnera subulata]|uniref:FAF domain-containing protein n=1 Tax=Turnera subulata TaxID=218843 RepID=A0A9Q0FLN8_9ROSI|nr:hypothetical protein Tsubulata_012654 [Turnera subulata]